MTQIESRPEKLIVAYIPLSEPQRALLVYCVPGNTDIASLQLSENEGDGGGLVYRDEKIPEWLACGTETITIKELSNGNNKYRGVPSVQKRLEMAGVVFEQK